MMMQQTPDPYYGHPLYTPPPHYSHHPHHAYYHGSYGMPPHPIHHHHHRPPQMAPQDYYPYSYGQSQISQPLFPNHKPPVPDADVLTQQHQYHQYMQAAAAKWYQSQHFRHQQYLRRQGKIDSETSSAASDMGASSDSRGAETETTKNTSNDQQ